ncbi:MAG: SulP family inorganic anion transporter [Anaerolineae bacterium]|nr:SulP family inorganic anion transporter [Anaerolineae bacterium]
MAGVLVVTTVRMNDWGDIRWMFRHRFKSALLGFLATLLATAALDLASAILIGVSVSAILFISRLSEIDVTRTDVDIKMLEERGYRLNGNTQDIGVAYVTGPLFFAATANFRKAFDTNKRYRHLVLSMRGVPTIDVSGLELIEELWERKKQQGGELLLCAVQPGVKKMLDRAGLTQEIGEDKFFWSADQAILAICNAADKGKQEVARSNL